LPLLLQFLQNHGLSMTFSPKSVCVSILAAVLAASLPTFVAAQNAQIRHIGVASSGGVTEIRIETSRRVMPLTQVLTDPDRLVIDFPDALPVAELHNVAAHQGEVKGVRTSLLTAKPPMTRIVIDLKSAQDFRLVPSATSITVRLLGSAPPLIKQTDVATAETKHTPAHEVVTAPVSPTPTPSEAAVAPPARVAPAPTRAAQATAAPEPPPVASRPALVATAKRPTITIERTASDAVRPTLNTATVVKPAVEAAEAAPAPPPPPAPAAAGPTQIRKVALLKSGGAMEIEIETSQRVVPATQLIASPDRLVLDFPGSFPGPQLRALSVNQGEVRGVRAALLSNNPPVTRVVLDLKSPQEFQVFPSTKSVVVKLPGSISPSHAPAPNQPVIDVASAPAPAPEPPPKKVTVELQNGQLRITSEKGSLADILNEVRAQTGAEIAIPSGAEQEQVVTTIGPTTPRAALSELLNGSRYNFIIVGTDADPNQLERVVLTPKGVIDANDTPPPAPDPVPVAQAAAPRGSMRSARRSMMPTPPPPPPPPTQVPQADDSQPQGDSNPPPDTTPQPGDPQPAPN
jgi:hypothetical protein